MEPGGLQKEKGPKAQDRKRRAGRDDVVRSCLPSSLALYWKLESKLVQKFKQQVRAADQAAYPEVTIESFVGHSSMGLLCPPAHGKRKQFKRIPVTTRGTHTRLPDKAKVRANAHVCTHMKQKNEDMTGGRDGTKVHVVELTGEPSAQGHPMKPTSL